MQWRVTQVESTGSTQQDVADLADAGEPAGAAVVAMEQTAGRGRLDRSWSTETGRGVALSVLLRPTRAASDWSWLPLLAGLAVSEALASEGVSSTLKWPNDVLLATDGGVGKVAGILAEQRGDPTDPTSGHVVLGMGLNILPPGPLAEEPLVAPVGVVDALSEPAEVDVDALTEALVRAILARLGERYESWASAETSADAQLRQAYEERCDSVGRQVRVLVPGGDAVVGTAVGLAGNGALLVRREGAADSDEDVLVSAGDVVHVR